MLESTNNAEGINMAGRIYTRRPIRSARRATEWIASADSASPQALGSASVLLDQDFTGAQVSLLSPFTITRTVGLLSVRGDQIGADEFPLMAMGGMVVQETARAAGVASLPTPIVEEGDDAWFLYVTATAASGTVNGAPVSQFHFDSRAQRKVEDGQAIVFVVENASSGFGIEYWLKFRMLIKVH